MRALATCCLLALAGCSVSRLEQAPAERVQNQCEEDAECGHGVCSDGTCQATSSQFEALLFQVTPPSMSGQFTGVSFTAIQYLNQADQRDIQLWLTNVAEIAGRVGPSSNRGCADLPNGESIPARVTLTPTEQFLGLPAASYSAQAALNPETGALGFKLRAPPGYYDVYVEPDSDVAAGLLASDACRVVPQLFRNQHFRAAAIDLPLSLPAPLPILVRVARPTSADRSLAGWTVEMIDHLTGRVISNRYTLSETDAAEYTAELWYSLPSGGLSAEMTGRELLRLRPPAENAPTLLLQRDGLELFTAGEATISQLRTLPAVVRVEGKVETRELGGSPKPVQARVSVVAMQMDGMERGSASFQATRETEPDGSFALEVPPGQYRVYAEPERRFDTADCSRLSSGLAATTLEWTIAASPAFQAGRVIDVERNSLLAGRSLTLVTQEPLIGASIHAVPSACAQPLDVLQDDAVPFAPRAASGSVCEDGEFAFSADTGIYDFSVRPPDGTGWPWLVVPTLAVPTGVLGDLLQPLPVRYVGSVSAGDKQEAVPGAMIRAYAFIDAEGKVASAPERATWVLAVAETRADETGRFELLLPEALSGEPAAGGMGVGGCF